ncbi:hypothetical protein EV401DRAFT_516428 [Pisolithus croceorrhizus]|nr:hypothetical protein EV401DRAFT_516428 [Pisolithus croceorrhizus]
MNLIVFMIPLMQVLLRTKSMARCCGKWSPRSTSSWRRLLYSFWHRRNPSLTVPGSNDRAGFPNWSVSDDYVYLVIMSEIKYRIVQVCHIRSSDAIKDVFLLLDMYRCSSCLATHGII